MVVELIGSEENLSRHMSPHIWMEITLSPENILCERLLIKGKVKSLAFAKKVLEIFNKAGIQVEYLILYSDDLLFVDILNASFLIRKGKHVYKTIEKVLNIYETDERFDDVVMVIIAGDKYYFQYMDRRVYRYDNRIFVSETKVVNRTSSFSHKFIVERSFLKLFDLVDFIDNVEKPSYSDYIIALEVMRLHYFNIKLLHSFVRCYNSKRDVTINVSRKIPERGLVRKINPSENLIIYLSSSGNTVEIKKIGDDLVEELITGKTRFKVLRRSAGKIIKHRKDVIILTKKNRIKVRYDGDLNVDVGRIFLHFGHYPKGTTPIDEVGFFWRGNWIENYKIIKRMSKVIYELVERNIIFKRD